MSRRGQHRGADGFIAPQLAALQALGLEGLRLEWRRLYGPPPKLRSPELLRRLIGWRLETEPDPASVEALKARLGGGARAASTQGGLLSPGSVVMREWQGVRHEALVLDGGKVRHNGQVYDSLSAVARAITGTRWNGPRFFGIIRAEAAK